MFVRNTLVRPPNPNKIRIKNSPIIRMKLANLLLYSWIRLNLSSFKNFFPYCNFTKKKINPTINKIIEKNDIKNIIAPPHI